MKKMKKSNEEMMFLGVDGFNEIESIAPGKKHQETAKAAHKQKNNFRETAAKLGKKLKASKTVISPAHIVGGKQERTVYKKRAVLAVGASVTAVMLSVVTVAGALGGQEKPSDEKPAAPAMAKSTADEAVELSSQAAENGASALYIDGKFAGAADNGSELKEALDKVLADAKAGYDDATTTEFANKIEIKPYSGSDATSVDELMAKTEGQLSIKLETDWTYESTVEFETEVTYDDSQPSDYEVVTREGVNGVTETTIRLTFTDGVQTDAVITGEKVITEAVNEQKTVGSANGTKSSSESGTAGSESKTSTGSGSSTGAFMWPVPHTHNITSYMEWRWGRMHNGIDIAGGDDYGQPIVASDGGVVTFAGNDGGGYGNYVMIDHGNGYMTVYGHASEICCTTGQYVNQGDTIALIGSTGNSTGPHLHFEIRLNGEYQNPLNYVS